MNQKSDKAKLAFFSESIKERMQIEISRVSQLYRADRVGGIRGHEMLHQASKDINNIFWQVSAMIGKEHQKIDYLHKVKRSMDQKHRDSQYLSKPTLESLDNFVLASKLYRSGLSDLSILKKTGRLARRLLRIDTICLRQDISDLLHKAKHTKVPNRNIVPESGNIEHEVFDEVELKDMEVKKVTR